VRYCQKFLDAYFGGGEYYYHDLEHYTVDELDTYIDLKYRELNEMNSMDDVDDKTGAGTANGSRICQVILQCLQAYASSQVCQKLTLDNDTFENTGKSRFFERRTSRVLY